jgi:hypothetical protein
MSLILPEIGNNDLDFFVIGCIKRIIDLASPWISSFYDSGVVAFGIH